MAWNTGTTYNSSSPVGFANFNGIGNDLRTWGGNVDANGFELSNCLAINGLTGANPLLLKTNGSERVRIDGTGKVGIGVTPLNKFHVNVAANENLHVRDAVDITGSTVIQTVNDANNANTPMEFRSTGFYFRVGNVAINKTSANSKLAVAGLVTYASNALALAGGLTAGDFYTDGAGAVKVTF